MSKIRVLEVIRQGQIGGGESHLLDLVTFMDRGRFEPVCLSFTDGEMVARLSAMGIRCHVISTLRPFDVRVQRQIVRLLRDEQIQLVHAHGSRAASNMLWPARRVHVPLVYTVHGWSFHDDQPRLVQLVRRWSERLICRMATRVICVSRSNAVTGSECFGLTGAEVIENGVNLERFSPDRQSGSLRATLGFSDGDFVVGFIARCTRQKAPLDFLEALLEAHGQDRRVKGLFVGEGDMDAEVDAYIAAHQMGSFVRRTPFRTDVPELLGSIDVYCLPSLWEGLSIALLEAMAMGKAVVATPTDGTVEVIEHGTNGLIVPFSQPARLADAFVRLLRDPLLRSQYGQHARQLVVRRFSARRVSESVEAIYRQVLL